MGLVLSSSARRSHWPWSRHAGPSPKQHAIASDLPQPCATALLGQGRMGVADTDKVSTATVDLVQGVSRSSGGGTSVLVLHSTSHTS